MNYTIQSGQTIYDVLLNTLGSWSALDEVLRLNGLVSYTPALSPGSVITTGDLPIVNNRTTLSAQEVPFATGGYPDDFEADAGSALSILETIFTE